MVIALGRFWMVGRRLLISGTLVVLVAILPGGCSIPISAEKESIRQNFREETTSALGSSDFSNETRQVLRRFDLERQYARTPEVALQKLHQHARSDDRRDVLCALAELNYAHAERMARSVRPGAGRVARDHYLAAAVYAHLYLISTGREQQPSPFDPRFRVACELYNRGLAEGFAPAGDTNALVAPEAGIRVLPPGPITLELSSTQNLAADPAQIDHLLSADRFRVRGLTVRNRRPGLGAPLIAVTRPADETELASRIPWTLFLRVEGDVTQWTEGGLRGTLEFHGGFDRPTVEVDGHTVPLQTDTTAPLAHLLSDRFVWTVGRTHFFSSQERVRSGIRQVQPYQPGRIPVVFVHGTFSSPVWWAEMWNTLAADPVLGQRCQFWNHLYNTGNPVTHSAAQFRAALEAEIEELDPEGRDPILNEMVVVGHSQGGLLAHLAVIDPEDRLWRSLTDRSLEDFDLTEEQRATIEQNFFFQPVAQIRRVVFVATPHRGSYRASAFVRRWAARFVRLPSEMVEMARGLWAEDLNLPPGVRSRIPTSLDSMAVNSPMLLTLAEIPPVPGVKAHSIIAVRGRGEPDTGSDGVVSVQSARVDFVESELIIRSGHSVQGTPPAIEEVRRILLEQVRQVFGPEATRPPTSHVGGQLKDPGEPGGIRAD